MAVLTRKIVISVAAMSTVCVSLLVAACSDEHAEAAGNSSEILQGLKPLPNRLVITADDHILWNGQQVTEQQLADLLTAAAQLDPEPEIRFQPDADANYDLSAKVIEIIRKSHVTKFGFIGNEAYSESEKPAD